MYHFLSLEPGCGGGRGGGGGGGGGTEHLVSIVCACAYRHKLYKTTWIHADDIAKLFGREQLMTSVPHNEDMIAALTLTFGTWSVISAMRDETTMTTLSSRASFTSNTNGITQWLIKTSA